MARRRFFVDEVRGGKAKVAGDEAHHLTRVLRVEPGQKYEISDNRSAYLAEVESARKDLVTFLVLDRLADEAPLLRTVVYASLIRFERFELLLEKATELGASRIVPVQAERSEKGLDRAALKRLPRWQRIVREAAEQSRRTQIPVIDEPVRLLSIVQAPHDWRLLLDEERSSPGILQVLSAALLRGSEPAILAGPEGGWNDRERASLMDAGWRAVSLGPSILRAETAVIAALAVLNAAAIGA
ncbi:MAG: 16S rRNA (uracil(1498)-N(3))-methyltransferase [Acidobacteriaceae bacterium]|nr:16S rRNA (uracil(1498)-N(3))-methyltransferase [Acidobacteriaceae bacterium]